MVCTSLGSLLRPLFYFLCYIPFSLSVFWCSIFLFSASLTLTILYLFLCSKFGHGENLLEREREVRFFFTSPQKVWRASIVTILEGGEFV